MRIFDLKTWQLIDTRQATIVRAAGLRARRPLAKILGDSVAFLTREADQEGNQDHPTATASRRTRSCRCTTSAASRRSRQDPTGRDHPAAAADHLPRRRSSTARCSNRHRPRRERGSRPDDIVVLVDGDSDGDGVFDSSDDCVETPDRSSSTATATASATPAIRRRSAGSPPAAPPVPRPPPTLPGRASARASRRSSRATPRRSKPASTGSRAAS